MKIASGRCRVWAIALSLPIAAPASASNFGDFPAIVPLLYLTPFVCLGIGLLVSLRRDEQGHAAGVNGRRMLIATLLALPAWLLVCFLLFLGTF